MAKTTAKSTARESTLRMAGTPGRREVLELLGRGPRRAMEIREALGIDQANCAHRVRPLRAAGLVTAGKDGQFTTYSLTRAGAAMLTRVRKATAAKAEAAAKAAARTEATRAKMDYPSRADLARRLARAVELEAEATGKTPNALMDGAGLTKSHKNLLYRYMDGSTAPAWGKLLFFAVKLGLDPRVLMPELFPAEDCPTASPPGPSPTPGR
jgi:DNA-binding transcriptional ArsR family regulator